MQLTKFSLFAFIALLGVVNAQLDDNPKGPGGVDDNPKGPLPRPVPGRVDDNPSPSDTRRNTTSPRPTQTPDDSSSNGIVFTSSGPLSVFAMAAAFLL